MYINSLAKILHVRRRRSSPGSIKAGLEATVRTSGKRASYVITPEAFRALYTRHLNELIAQKRIPSVALFEAFYSYFFVPKHTIGTQLLTEYRGSFCHRSLRELPAPKAENAQELEMNRA